MSHTQYNWNEQQQLYLEQTWNGSQWVATWMPAGFRPPQQQQQQQQQQPQPQPNLPRTPVRHNYTDSAYGSSPAQGPSPHPSTISRQAGGSYYATPAATSLRPQSTYNYGVQTPGFQFHQGTSSTGSTDRNRLPASGRGDSTGKPLPRGKGAEIQGHYNAKLGNTPANLHYEKVDPSFYVRDRKFFQEGKVFAVIFTEEAGSTIQPATSYNSCLSEARFSDHIVYTQSRRFVVVRSRREFCFACPIFTYSNRATLKRGVRPAEHGIVYSEGQQPKLLDGETGIRKPSLAVAMTHGEPSLDIASRIYYGIHHPIQYNVKVKDIGQVLPHHVPTLIGNWKAEDSSETKQGAEVTAAAEQPDLPHVPEEEHGDESDYEVESPSNRHARITQNIPQSPSSHKDPHLYHPKNNVWGYDAKTNPYMYHPVHNPYGYHPKNNTHGYHPESNPCSFHPVKNPYGYHPQKTPFCYHPRFSPYGYHGELNVHGYHPDVTPFNYHPQSNPGGYHPTHNVYGYHPDNNPHGYHQQQHPYGYHPTLYPNNYHPKWNPQGQYYGHASSTIVAPHSENTTAESNEGEEEDEEYEEEGSGYEVDDPSVVL